MARSSYEGWIVAGMVAFFLVGALDVAGALSLRVGGSGLRFVGLRPMGNVAFAVARHLRDPALAWPAAYRAKFSASTFWGIAGLLALGICILGVAVRVVLQRSGLQHFVLRRSPRGQEGATGFATHRGIDNVATLRAARKRAPQTRPGLVATLPHVFGHPRLSRLPASSVGYRLGVTTEPKGVPLVAHFEASLRLVAPPGEGKTARFMVPIGREHPGPLFATSTKADLYEGLVTAREDGESGAAKRPVWALDPDGLVPGANPVRWSPVAGCESTRTAERRAGALIAAGADVGDVTSGAFFRSSAQAVLATLLHAAALGGRTMRDVLSWAADPTDKEPFQLLDRRATDTLDWGARLARHTQGAEATTSGVLRTLELALACFQHDDVLELCSPAREDEFDFVEFIEKRGTVFALGKDRPGGVGPLVTAFAEELLFVAEEQAARRSTRRLDPPLMFLLDEAPSIAPLPSLPTLAADGRGRGIVLIYAMQSFSQAEARWGRHGAETLANATTLTCVFGGLKVTDDLRELSRLCGTKRVLRHSSSEDLFRNGQSVSSTWMEEPVLEESAIRMLADGVALLLWAKLPPILSYLPGSWEGRSGKEWVRHEQSARAANDQARAQREGTTR